MHEFDDRPGDAEGFAFFGFAGLGIISACGGAWPVAAACGAIAVLLIVVTVLHTKAAQGTEARRAETENTGSVHDGPVGNADASEGGHGNG